MWSGGSYRRRRWSSFSRTSKSENKSWQNLRHCLVSGQLTFLAGRWSLQFHLPWCKRGIEDAFDFASTRKWELWANGTSPTKSHENSDMRRNGKLKFLTHSWPTFNEHLGAIEERCVCGLMKRAQFGALVTQLSRYYVKKIAGKNSINHIFINIDLVITLIS